MAAPYEVKLPWCHRQSICTYVFTFKCFCAACVNDDGGKMEIIEKRSSKQISKYINFYNAGIMFTSYREASGIWTFKRTSELFHPDSWTLWIVSLHALL